MKVCPTRPFAQDHDIAAGDSKSGKYLKKNTEARGDMEMNDERQTMRGGEDKC